MEIIGHYLDQGAIPDLGNALGKLNHIWMLMDRKEKSTFY